MLRMSVDGRNLQLKLENLVQTTKQMSEPLEKSGSDLLILFSEKVFETQGRAIDENWKKLAATTLRARAMGWGYYGNTPIETGKKLVWTGRLKSGFKKTVTKTRLEISNKVKYFKYNQKTRPMLKISQEVVNIVTRNFENFILKNLK